MRHGSLQRIYDRVPPVVQTLALNAYGINTLRRRRRWNRVLGTALHTETWDAAAQRHYVGERLRGILLFAIAEVPRYGGLKGLTADLRMCSTSEVYRLLLEFPITTKDELRLKAREFMSSQSDNIGTFASRTSGTMGTPLTILVDRATHELTDALAWRRTVWAGWEPGDWIARMVGDRVVPLGQAPERRIHRSSRLDRRLYLSAYHLSERTAGMYVAALRETRPAFVMGYPSALCALCRLVGHPIAAGDWRPKAVLYSSEPLHVHHRQIIEASFRAPCRGFYGSAERVVSASECDSGVSHLSLIDGYLERQFESRSRTEEPAIVTTLSNRAMPLIRYRVDDAIQRLGWLKCSCGRTLPAIGPVVTKAEDVVTTPTGRVISPSILTWAFKDVEGLVASQIVQKSERLLEVRLVCAEGDFPVAASTVAPRLCQLVFDEMEIVVKECCQVPVTQAGKTRFVVNECARQSHADNRPPATAPTG